MSPIRMFGYFWATAVSLAFIFLPTAAKIDVEAFVVAIEDKDMGPEEATKRFLTGHSHEEIMTAAMGAVVAFAPKAVRLMAGGGACSDASPVAVAKLLTVHHETCSFSPGLSHSIDSLLKEERGAPEVRVGEHQSLLSCARLPGSPRFAHGYVPP